MNVAVYAEDDDRKNKYFLIKVRPAKKERGRGVQDVRCRM